MLSSCVFLLILGGIFLIFGQLIPKLNQEPSGKSGEGEITRIIQEDGYIFYYVRFQDDARVCEGTTIYYAETNNKYRIGDTVSIEYFVAQRSGRYRLRIVDDDLVPAGSRSVPTAARVCKIIGIALLGMAVCLLVSNLFRV